MAAVRLGSKAVGSIIKLKENGKLVDFIIVHNGLPSSDYDASCNGVWVLRRYVWPYIVAGEGNPNYATSPFHSWLENTYYNMFDAGIRSGIRQAKIPYIYLNGTSQTSQVYVTGASGVAAHCFLLSYHETGFNGNFANHKWIGSPLSYFGTFTDANVGNYKAVATDEIGNNVNWFLRDISYSTSVNTEYIISNGRWGGVHNCINSNIQVYMRPAMILDPNLMVSDDGSVAVNTAPAIPGSISVPGSIKGGSTITVSWGASTDPQGNLEGYKVERSTNGGASWTQIYQGNSTSITNNVTYGTASVMYRVKAYDSMGLESGYRTSNNVAVINNTAPIAPQGISVPLEVPAGRTVQISWIASTDAEDNLAGYELERSVDGGDWDQVYRGDQIGYADSITRGWTSVAYRVRAYDDEGEYSAYTASETRSVDNNMPPGITCAYADGSDIGIQAGGFSISYSIDDEDNSEGDVTATESLDGVQVRSYQPVFGDENKIDITGERFLRLLNGQHTVSISATDGKAVSSHTVTFTKEATSASITLSEPLRVDGPISACVISVNGHIPDDASCRILVTRNADDDAPDWEDCTQDIENGVNHVFGDNEAANGYAFNFRIMVERGESGEGGYITSIQGGFQ